MSDSAPTADRSPLVDAEHLDPAGSLLIDASVHAQPREDGAHDWVSGREAFEREHLPGAVFADLISAFSDPESDLPFTLPTRERFEAEAQKLGVRHDSRVVVYDTGNGAFSARLWWLFRAFGHTDVAVLNGGLNAWKARGGSVADGAGAAPEPGNFRAERPEDRHFIDKAGVERIVATGHGVLISALPPDDPEKDAAFRGRAGRIPGTVTIPAGSVLQEDGTLRTIPELREIFGSALGADRTRPVVTYCGGGIAASLAALALVRSGLAEPQLYDGSLNEWAQDPDAPLVVARDRASH